MASSEMSKNKNKKQKIHNIIDTATLTWTYVESNSRRKDLRFSTPNKGHIFLFFFYPKPTFQITQNVLLIVHALTTTSLFRYRVSVLGSNGDKQFTYSYEYDSLSSKRNLFEEYIPFNTFHNILAQNNNTCKLFVEVDVLEEMPSSSPVETIKADVSHDFGTLLETGKLSDMILTAGGKDFAVHKNILAARSPVFGAMFEHSETQEMLQNRISIEDMSSDVCQEMLKHIYTGSFPSNMSEFAFDLFVAADKYQLTQLKSACEEAMDTLLDVDTVCTVLLQADGCNSLELKYRCIQFIMQNAAEVMKTEGWNAIVAKNDLLAELFQKATQEIARLKE